MQRQGTQNIHHLCNSWYTRNIKIGCEIKFLCHNIKRVLNWKGQILEKKIGSGRNCSSVLILLASRMTYTITMCTVKKTADDGQRNCPKHVEIYSKNKFEKLVHLLASCQQTCMTYTIAVCTVKNCWWWTEELSETCKGFIPKINLRKLVHLVGFVIRIYHDARSPER